MFTNRLSLAFHKSRKEPLSNLTVYLTDNTEDFNRKIRAQSLKCKKNQGQNSRIVGDAHQNTAVKAIKPCCSPRVLMHQ